MPDSNDSRSALDAAIERHADTVRRSRTTNKHGFLKQLGLSLPVTVDDVKQAFYSRAKETHPDHAGDPAEFRKMQAAFDEALHYAETNGKRMPWLGAQLPLYVAQERVLKLVESWGGRASVQELTWLEDTVGIDFAKLANRLDAVDLSGAPIGDAELADLFSDPEGLQYLDSLNLSDTRVTDNAILEVMKAPRLRRLNLRGTDVTFNMRRQLVKLTRFEQVEGANWFAEFFRRRTGS